MDTTTQVVLYVYRMRHAVRTAGCIWKKRRPR